MVAGVRGACLSDGLVPRAWLVLSNSAKAKGVDCMLKAIEDFLRNRLSDQHWLHGGLEVIDEVQSQFGHLLCPVANTDVAAVNLDTKTAVRESATSSAATYTRESEGEESQRPSKTVVCTLAYVPF